MHSWSVCCLFRKQKANRLETVISLQQDLGCKWKLLGQKDSVLDTPRPPVPPSLLELHRILRFRMGSHHLPLEESRHSNQPQASRVCNLCNTGALGDERHMLPECLALAGLRLQFLLSCSSVMRRLLWAKDQHEVCRYIIACHDRMSSH